MHLFIFESIGTSELMLIGIVALMFLGPRKLPEMAKKVGKIMADFRNTTSEFKETWEREINFDEEVKSLTLNDLESASVSRLSNPSEIKPKDKVDLPTIKEIDPLNFDNPLGPINSAEPESNKSDHQLSAPTDALNDKKNWL